MNTEALSFRDIGIWVCVAFVVGQYYNSWRANKIAEEKLKQPQQNIITPQPLVVELAKQFATKDELGDLKKDMDGRFDKIDSKLDDRLTTLDNKRDRQISELHEKINEVSGDVSYIRGKMEGNN